MKTSYIAVGYKCNHHCIMCPLSTADRLHGSFSYEQIMTSINNAGLSAGDHITVSGGEPTLCPFFPELIRELVRRRLRITLLSNGVGFTDPQMVARLADLVRNYPFNVVIALHSADAETHDEMTGHPGSFVDSMVAIHRLQRAGVNVTIKHILCRKTISGLCDLAKMIAAEFPPNVEIQFTSMDYSGRAAKQHEALAITADEIRGPLHSALDVFLRQCAQPYRVSMIEMPLCACPPEYWHCIHQMPNTNLYVAPNAETPDNIIHELPNQCGVQYPPCKECDVRSVCPGTWRSAYDLMGPKLLNPVKCKFQNG